MAIEPAVISSLSFGSICWHWAEFPEHLPLPPFPFASDTCPGTLKPAPGSAAILAVPLCSGQATVTVVTVIVLVITALPALARSF